MTRYYTTIGSSDPLGQKELRKLKSFNYHEIKCMLIKNMDMHLMMAPLR